MNPDIINSRVKLEAQKAFVCSQPLAGPNSHHYYYYLLWVTYKAVFSTVGAYTCSSLALIYILYIEYMGGDKN